MRAAHAARIRLLIQTRQVEEEAAKRGQGMGALPTMSISGRQCTVAPSRLHCTTDMDDCCFMGRSRDDAEG